MSLPALIPLLLASTGVQLSGEYTTAPDPVVQVWLNSDATFERGERARAFVRPLYDGFLVVLHADPAGRVRILHPIDPFVDDFVRGGQTIEIRGRGDRDAFFVDERSGSGLVLAAWSRDPFRFDPFVRGDHWDYRQIAPAGVYDDPEAGLLDIVYALADGRSFDYDVAPYVIGERGRYYAPVRFSSVWSGYSCVGCYRRPHLLQSGFHFSIGFGVPYFGVHFGTIYPYHYAWLYPPFYYDPFRYKWARVWHPWYYYDYDPYYRRYRSVGIHYPYRYAWDSCRGDPYCRRYRPGIGTGVWLADDAGERDRRARLRGQPSDGPPSSFGGTRNIALPEGEPSRARAIPSIERGTDPSRASSGGSSSLWSRGAQLQPTDPSRARTIPSIERESRPPRSSSSTIWSRGAQLEPTEPSRARTIPSIERGSDPSRTNQPSRSSSSIWSRGEQLRDAEPSRSRVTPPIERRPDPRSAVDRSRSTQSRSLREATTPERSRPTILRGAIPRSSSDARPSSPPSRDSRPSVRTSPPRSGGNSDMIRSRVNEPRTDASRSRMPPTRATPSRPSDRSGIAGSARRPATSRISPPRSNGRSGIGSAAQRPSTRAAPPRSSGRSGIGSATRRPSTRAAPPRSNGRSGIGSATRRPSTRAAPPRSSGRSGIGSAARGSGSRGAAARSSGRGRGSGG